VHGHAAAGIRLDLDLEPVTLSMDQAVPCGLLLNEVASNALKHAFRGRSNGQLMVSLRHSPDGTVNLGVRDDGVGLPEGLDWRRTPSLGLQLVQMLAAQLNGTVEVRNNAGTEVQVSFEATLSGRAPDESPQRAEQTA
jgi:two-component sensor histidine kinase